MTLLAKLGLSVLGGGSVAAGGYGIYEFMRPKTIKEQLKWEGFSLSDVDGATDDDFWKEQVKKYEKDTKKNTGDKFKKIGKEESEPDISNEKDLKKQCEKVFNLTPSDKDNLEKAKKWCVKPLSLKK